MKAKLVFIAIILALVASPVFADPQPDPGQSDDKLLKPAQKISKCAKFEIYSDKVSDCLTCHVAPDMRLKEVDPHKWREYPNYDTQILADESGEYGYFFFIGDVNHNVSAKYFYEFFRYLQRNNVNRAVIEIQSFGGSVFEGWRIKGIIDEFQCSGIKITTKVHSIAASAATLVFLAADDRVMSPTAELMFHELWTFKFLAIESPADKEDEARVLRHIQDTITEWTSSRSNMTKEEVDAKIRKKELWVRGTEAYDLGFATKLIGR